MDVIAEPGLFTAVVHAPDGVRFVASALDEADVTGQLVGYVSERCYDTLWPADARAVHDLIDAGRGDEAVATYFAKVGQRWDEEHLEGPLPWPPAAPAER
ncbi:MAG TPA: hypothetical protein VF483_01910 [Gemmatimonadaceae bacterium]